MLFCLNGLADLGDVDDKQNQNSVDCFVRFYSNGTANLFVLLFLFFPIPSFGNSTSADPNEKCTSAETRAGQLIKFEGGVLRVKTILGASPKCTTDRLPILILTEKIEYEPRPLQATLALSNSWTERALTDQMTQSGVRLYAINSSLDIGVKLSTADIRFVLDFKSTIRKIYDTDIPQMTERSATNLSSTTVSAV